MFVKHKCPPSENIWTIGLTFDPDLWPTDLSIDRDHLLNKDYLLTKFEAYGECVLELSVAQGVGD